jgi:hypothetical protein
MMNTPTCPFLTFNAREQSMAAYVIAEVEVLDPALIEKYRTLAQDSIARYDGQYNWILLRTSAFQTSSRCFRRRSPSRTTSLAVS